MMKKLFLLIALICSLGLNVVAQTAFKFGIEVNDIGYDSQRNLIYATVRGSDPSYTNSLIAIDPYDNMVTQSVFVGKEPGDFIFTSDSAFIYIAFDADTVVRKFSLNEFKIVQEIALGKDANGYLYAHSLAVLPGEDDAIIVSKKYSNLFPPFASLSVYKDGKILPGEVVHFLSSNIDKIVSTGNDTIYGYSENTSPDQFYVITATADSGASIIASYNDLVSLSNPTYHDGIIYDDNGLRFDPNELAYLTPFRLSNPIGYSDAANFLCCIDDRLDKAFFCEASGRYEMNVVVFDKSSSEKIGTMNIGMDCGIWDPELIQLIRFGENGLAMIVQEMGIGRNSMLMIVNDLDFSLPNVVPSTKNSSGFFSRIYGNPAKDYLNIAISDAVEATYKIRIYDNNGNVIKFCEFQVLGAGENQLKVNLSDMPPSLYIVTISRDNTVLASHKFVKL